jgi:hypothetical protein
MTKDEWREQCACLEEYLWDRFEVEVVYETDSEDSYDPNEKKIVVNSRQWPENQFYTLLHEAGHVYHRFDYEENRESYYFPDMNLWCGIAQADKRKNKKKSYRVSVAMDEADAWRSGYDIATELELYVDAEKYNKTVTEHMFEYLCWAVE